MRENLRGLGVLVVRIAAAAGGLVLGLAGLAAAQSTTRVSVDSSGAEANNASGGGSLSGDGRYVVFSSFASNLAPGDTNGAPDIFVHDRQAGTTVLASPGLGGLPANGPSEKPCISADGRYVVFESQAGNLVPNDLNGGIDVFVRDLVAGTTTIVSVSSTGVQSDSHTSAATTGPHISGDGRYCVFWSNATTLDPGDTNGVGDIYLHDLATGSTVRVSIDSAGGLANGQSWDSAISADGRYVAFNSSASNLVPGDINGVSDVFVHDMLSGATVLASVDSSGTLADGASSFGVSISGDGRLVAFASGATNLDPLDTNGLLDIFVHDMLTGVTRRASVGPQGLSADQHCYRPMLSEDGRFVAFETNASNLVPLDTNLEQDVFVHDLQNGTTLRASVDSSGTQGNALSGGAWLSADGSVVGFSSQAFDLVPGDTNQVGDAFVFVPSAINVEFACAGDDSLAPCPCANTGAPFHGCDNSYGQGGALLGASGFAGLSADSFVMTCISRYTVLNIFVQGDAAIAPQPFGDGLRCTGGTLLRMYALISNLQLAIAPGPGDLAVSARAAQLGDTIAPGGVRWYQAYYRDPDPAFCSAPAGSTFNISNGLRVVWSQ